MAGVTEAMASLYATPHPQAKGNVARRHDDWPKRLPPLLAAGPILPWGGAHTRLPPRLAQANEPEGHRELGTSPQAAP